ncbi:MAG: ATP-binding protein [Gammaproteobacteria bacterium]|nr:ATP-binding protein [Gammaproteobacteria bacterium]
MGPSIRRSLLLILIPFVIGSWLIAAVLSYYDTKTDVTRILDAQLAQSGQLLLAISLHELVEQRLLSEEEENVTEKIASKYWQHDSDVLGKIAFQVWLNNDTLAIRSDNAPITPMSENSNGFYDTQINEAPWRIYTIASEDNLIRAYVGMHTDLQNVLATSVVRKIMIPFLISLPFLAFFVWRIVNSNLAPLQTMARELATRKSNDLTPLDDYKIPFEVRPITAAINQLFDHMKTAIDSEKRFTSDAAHELRTPLAALKTHAEIALGAKSEEEQRKALRQVVQGVNRATRLVEQLLTLARLDPDTGFTNIRRFDLFIVAENVLSDEAHLAIDKNIEISLSGTRGKFVAANADAIKVLMRNLIDNAIRYTPPGGEVEVHISRNDNDILFRVADSGVGIPEEERSKVFNRFYRTLGTKESGSGLGLSIVTRIVELHNISISLDESRMGGAQFDVIFPAKDNDDE